MTSTRSAIEITVSEGVEITSNSKETVDPAGHATSQTPTSTSPKTRELALVAVLTALYIAANSVPIDAFIGGTGFITAGIILLPVIARLLKPWESLAVAVAAPVGLFAFQLSVIPIFGFYGMLIPASAIVFGSLGYYRSYIIPAAYIAFGAAWYLAFSNGTVVWLLPYFIAMMLTVLDQVRPFVRGRRSEVLFYSFLVTMCELVTMNIGSISLLRLPGNLWTVITPFMFLERTVAVIGATAVLMALLKVKPILKIEEI